jgi:EF hand
MVDFKGVGEILAPDSSIPLRGVCSMRIPLVSILILLFALPLSAEMTSSCPGDACSLSNAPGLVPGGAVETENPIPPPARERRGPGVPEMAPALTGVPGSGEAAPRRGGFAPERLIQRFDADGNGVLEVTELGEGQRAERFAAADADGDGILTAEELTAHMQTMAPPTAGAPGSPEADSGPGRRRGRGFTPESFVQQYDTDGNGTVEVTELGEGPRAERFAAADTDGDGTLSAEEIETHFQSMRQRMREGGFSEQRGQRQRQQD